MERPHVIGIGQAEIVIETMAQRQKVRGITEVPLAENRSAITALLVEFSQRHLVGAQADLGARAQSAVNAKAIGVTAGEQGGARSRAYRLGDVEIPEDAA